MSVRVLIVDDSALVRRVLKRALAEVAGVEVIGTAGDPYEARDKIVELKPDAVTLDLAMPRMDGLSFLRRLMVYWPVPVVVVSSLTPANSAMAIEALACGAIDVFEKPKHADSWPELGARLAERLKKAAKVRIQPNKPHMASTTITSRQPLLSAAPTTALLALGASTGGTVALEKVLSKLPDNAPGCVVVQHMPPGFTRSFAERLNDRCAMRVAEAVDQQPVLTGQVLIAPGDHHLVIERTARGWRARVKDGPLVGRHRPAVDVMFQSLARVGAKDVVAALLTGMGRDGAEGLLALRKAGAYTIAQDEATSVVYGMPRAAAELDAACAVLPLDQIAPRLLMQVSRKGAPAAAAT